MKGEIAKPNHAFLCIEGIVLCEVPLDEIQFILLCAFYIFNMQYTNSCMNFYSSYMEHIFLDLPLPKRTKLRVWRDFCSVNSFSGLGLMLNIDWFRPFKRSEYKVSAIMLTVLNLPRMKKKWTILAGMIWTTCVLSLPSIFNRHHSWTTGATRKHQYLP